MALDLYPGMSPGSEGPAVRALLITPNDGAPLPMVARSIWVGTSGNITLICRDDQAPVTFSNVPAGLFQVWAKQVLATGTTATNLIALA